MQDTTTDFVTRKDIDEELDVVDYVAGRLDAAARKAFETRLAADSALRARVADEEGLRSALLQRTAGDVPEAAAFDKLRAEVDAEASPTRSWRLGAVAAVVVVAASVALFSVAPDGPGDEGFKTLSDDGAVSIDDGRQVRIVFTEGTDATTREALAKAFGFTIVSASGPAGSYIVESTRPVNRDELASWRDDPRIDLAEPVAYRPQP